MENNKEICNKEGLHRNLKEYYVNNKIDIFKSLLPLTFHVTHNDPITDEWDEFENYYKSINEKVWIIKPGTNSNKGYGIKVSNNIKDIKDYTSNVEKHSYWIVQKYIERPMLIQNRKFDIRIYGLISTIHGRMQAYFFKHC